MSFIDNIKKSLPKGVAGQIWTEEELAAAEPEITVVVAKSRTPTPGAPTVNFNTSSPNSWALPIASQSSSQFQATLGSIGSIGSEPVGLDVFTQALKDATDFDKTDVGKQVAKEMKPLEGLQINESQRIGVVLKAGADEGLTGERIISTLDDLLKALDTERDRFQAQIAAATKTDVDDCKTAIDQIGGQIKSLETQITELRSKQSQMSTDMITAQSKLQIKASQFSAAYEARKADLTNSRNHYAEILKGIA